MEANICIFLLAFIFFQGVNGFFPNNLRAKVAEFKRTPESISHKEMSKKAFFDFITETFENMDQEKLPEKTADIIKILKEFKYYKSKYRQVNRYFNKFSENVEEILDSNEETDLDEYTINNPTFHFDAELMHETNIRMINEKNQIIAYLKKNEFFLARKLIGQYFHTLQDFYSHSNWVEMKNTDINFDIGERFFLNKIAQKAEPTCVSCHFEYKSEFNSEYGVFDDPKQNCTDNIKSDLNEKKILTSGYFTGQTLDGEPVLKLENKCSHGGFFDDTRKIAPFGGINKDSLVKLFSPHYYLHLEAVSLAEKASLYFLQRIQSEVGIEKSLCIFGIMCTKNVLFLIDATGSMETLIDVAKQRANSIFKDYLENSVRLNLTIAFFDDPFRSIKSTTFTNITTEEEYLRIMSLINPKQPLPILKQVCVYIPFYFCYCCEYDNSNWNTGREMINSRISYFVSNIVEKTDFYLFTDSLPRDEILLMEVIAYLKLKSIRFHCPFCPFVMQRSLNINSYQKYVQYTDGSYEKDGKIEIQEFSPNLPVYSILILQNDSLNEQIYIDSFIKNITIEVQTKGSYTINDLNLADDSKNFLKLGDINLNFNLSEKFTLNIYGENDFFISYRFYEYFSDSSHPGDHYFDKPVSGTNVAVSFTFSDEVAVNLTQLSILDHETDLEISKSIIEGYDSNITIPDRKCYFSIKGFDSNGSIFQRYLKQIPFDPLFYSIEFKSVLANNSVIMLNIIIKSSSRFTSSIALDISTKTTDQVKLVVTPALLEINSEESGNFSCKIVLVEGVELMETSLTILPIIYINKTETFIFDRKLVSLDTFKREIFENATELEHFSTESPIETTPTMAENSSLESEDFTTADDSQDFFDSTVSIDINTTKENVNHQTSLLSKFFNLIIFLINYIISFL